MFNFIAMPTHEFKQFQRGKVDANNQVGKTQISNGSGLPCRHCLTDIDQSDSCLLFAYRPFNSVNPYTESGPVFIHKQDCKRFVQRSIPKIILERQHVIIRGYDDQDTIVEDTGQVIKTDDFMRKAKEVLYTENVDYMHVRSASNNCYFCRVELG